MSFKYKLLSNFTGCWSFGTKMNIYILLKFHNHKMLLKCFFYIFIFFSQRAVQPYKSDDSQTVTLAIFNKNDFTTSNFWTDFKFLRKTVKAKFLIREMFKVETILSVVDSEQINVNFCY